MNPKYSRYFRRQSFFILMTVLLMGLSAYIMGNRLGIALWEIDWMQAPSHLKHATVFQLLNGNELLVPAMRMIAASLAAALWFVLLLLFLSYSKELGSHWLVYRQIKKGEREGTLLPS